MLLAIPISDALDLAIQYSDSTPDDGIWLAGDQGHAVLFSPPDNWTLSRVAVCGMLNRDGIFVLEIWNADLNLVYRTTDLSGAYFGSNLSWAEIDVPDLRIDGPFFVVFFEYSTVFVGIDNNTTLNRSFVASRSPSMLSSPGDYEWMIAAIGYISSRPPRINASSENLTDGVVIRADLSDPDGDLGGVSLYIFDQKSGEVVWVERADLNGSESEVRFIWPRVVYSVSCGSERVSPVVAVETRGIPENISRYMRYSAPCLLNLTDEGPFSDALAYFGEDMELHAIEGLDGRIHYISKELFEALRPGARYSDYVRNNITVIEGKSSLRFLSMGESLAFHRPLYLKRSPAFHYDMKLEREAAGSQYAAVLIASDFHGAAARATLDLG
ncbi:MAG TPA: hypothetical protein PK659_06145 [Methanothrix sp.]|nr:hypothetical protein [Methanothrix sp.]HOK58645.1 hypothetical protein [Methanothrix sp.]HOL43814.1 hypothetical protein [Methanothrix sp.]HPO88899.1 hypothetical protein [Methanothrix sp.]